MRRVDPRQAGFDLRKAGLTAGIDEAGRGPLAGPVVAAAVILDRKRPIRGIADSKVLAPAVREELARRIQQRSIACSLGWADACEVDAINILQATMLAMRRAMLGLRCAPAHVIVDGDRLPEPGGPAVRLQHRSSRRGRLQRNLRGSGVDPRQSGTGPVHVRTRGALPRVRLCATQGVRHA